MIVVIPPFGELCLRFLQGDEPLDVEGFVAEPAIEAFDEPVLNWPSWADEAQLYARFYRPHLHGAPGEHAAIIQGDAPRRAPAFGART
jgi:hypothetical protein